MATNGGDGFGKTLMQASLLSPQTGQVKQ